MAHLPRPRCRRRRRRRRGLLKVPNIAPQPASTRIQLCVHTNRSKVTKCIRCLSFWKTIFMVKKQALIEGAYSLVNVNSCVVNSTTQCLWNCANTESWLSWWSVFKEGADSLVNVNSCVVNSTTQYLIANYLFLFSKSLAYFHFAYYRLLEICNSWNGIFFGKSLVYFNFANHRSSFRFVSQINVGLFGCGHLQLYSKQRCLNVCGILKSCICRK